jgi:hypothetical protein
LKTIGEVAESQLEEALQSGDLERLFRVRQLLDRIQSHRDSHLRERLLEAALQVLQHNPSPRATAVLLDIFPLLGSRHLYAAASETCWANVRGDDEDRIRAALTTSHLPTQLAAIVALELAVGARSVPDLEGLLDDPQAAIRLAASRALLNHLPRQCLRSLIGLLAEEDLQIRTQALWLLRDLTGQTFGEDGSQDMETAVNLWRRWLEANADTAPLRVPVGRQRLQLAREAIVFRESFAEDAASIKTGYGRFTYESSLPAKASVAGGVLRLDGDHPEADQRLCIAAKNVTGRREFPRRFSIKAKLTGGAAGSGGYHVGVSVGQIKVLLHPAHPGGGFRVETVDTHQYLISNQSLGFTPAADVMHEMEIRVSTEEDGQVRLVAVVTNGNDPRQKYAKSFECDPEVTGPLDRIGLERSGRTGGAGLFDSLTIDLSGRQEF